MYVEEKILFIKFYFLVIQLFCDFFFSNKCKGEINAIQYNYKI